MGFAIKSIHLINTESYRYAEIVDFDVLFGLVTFFSDFLISLGEAVGLDTGRSYMTEVENIP